MIGHLMGRPLAPAKRNRLLERAATALQQGNAAAANTSAALIVKNDPLDSDALIVLFQSAPGAQAVPEALRLFKQALKAGNTNPDVAICLGNLQAQTGDLSGAENSFRQVLTRDPVHRGARQNLANVLMQSGKPNAAIPVFEDLMNTGGMAQAGPGLANALMMTGNLVQAAAVLERVLEKQPAHIAALNNLGQVHLERGDLDKAAISLEKAHELAPDHPGVLLALGSLRRRQDRLDDAIALVRRAVELRPDASTGYVSLCDMLERTNATEETGRMVAAGLSRFPDHPGLIIQAARLERRAGRVEQATARLERLENLSMDVKDRAARFQELGILYNEQSDYDRAFRHFGLAKQQFSILSRQRGVSDTLFFDDVAKMDSFVRATEFDSLPRLETVPDVQSPVFVVGFLRSGTTVLHQILDSHADVTVVDEKPMSLAAKAVLEASPDGFPAALADGDQKYLERARDAYFHSLLENVGADTGNRRIVDKFPFNLMRIPLLWRLFPAATFIVALRHPLDVCLSCYMQAFQPSAVTNPLLTLAGTVKAYVSLMEMWRTFAEKAPIRHEIVRYEDLIADQEATTRRLYEAVGLSWTDKALSFHEHARQLSRVNNPSYHQVVKPLYAAASGRWRRYEHHLEPYKSTLRPLAEAFGYRVDTKISGDTGTFEPRRPPVHHTLK